MECIASRLNQVLEQRGHRRSFIDEDAYVSLRLGQHKRLLQCLDRSCSFILCLMSQCLENQDFDDAVRPSGSGRCYEHPVEQCQGLVQAARGVGFGAGDEYAGEGEVLLLARVGRVCDIAIAVGPAGGGGEIVLQERESGKRSFTALDQQVEEGAPASQAEELVQDAYASTG
jgi:hypothetical protein